MRMLQKAAAITAVAASALLSVQGLALADPPSGTTPASGDVVGVGSDTTEFPLNQLSQDYNAANSGAKLYSWNATNPATGAVHENITPKSGAASIQRPDGSSEGIKALDNNTKTNGTNYDLDFARSSRGRQSGDPAQAAGGIQFVAFAQDAVTYATQSTSNVPTNLTTAQLKSIYTCTQTTWPNIKPFLPQSGSGTRAFFLSAIGVATPGSCVSSSVQENDGTQSALNDPWAIVPFSISKYIAETYHSAQCGHAPTAGQNAFGCDQHGTMVLNSIDGVNPTDGSGASTVIGANFVQTNYARLVYNVSRYDTTTSDNIPAYLENFFGSNGWICTNSTAQTDLTNYGLLTTPLCGTAF